MRRLFWIGAAALLGVAALVSIVALLRGEFTETDGRILASLGITLGAGAAALAGLALLERNDFVALGWVAVPGALVGYLSVLRDIWTEPWNDRATLTALLLLGALLLATTNRLLLRRSSLEPLVALHLVLSSFSTATTVWLIWDEGPTDDMWEKMIAASWILTALAWTLVPVLGRTSRSAGERVVGHGPGRYEVELAEGETLLVRR